MPDWWSCNKSHPLYSRMQQKKAYIFFVKHCIFASSHPGLRFPPRPHEPALPRARAGGPAQDQGGSVARGGTPGLRSQAHIMAGGHVRKVLGIQGPFRRGLFIGERHHVLFHGSFCPVVSQSLSWLRFPRHAVLFAHFAEFYIISTTNLCMWESLVSIFSPIFRPTPPPPSSSPTPRSPAASPPPPPPAASTSLRRW